MTDSTFAIANDFQGVDYATWRKAVEADLKGVPFERKLVTHTYEGIDIQPVYTLADRLAGEDPTGFPGAFPFTRGSRALGQVLNGVDLRQEHAHPDVKLANEAILADLEGGVTSLILRLDRATRRGRNPSDSGSAAMLGDDGLMVYGLDDLDAVLDGVLLDLVDITLDAGANFAPAAAMLTALWRRRGISDAMARGAFHADPLGTLASEGELPVSIEAAMAQMAQLAKATAGRFERVKAVSVDTSVYHDSGATAAEDLAFSMATAVQYLRCLTDAGMTVDAGAKQMLFRFSLGTHHFLAISKLRAARQLWARVLQASGVADVSEAGMAIHTRTGQRVMTQRDPYVNLLRNTVAVFAGVLGGADAITSLPFDDVVQLPDRFSRRIARNTVLVLQEESHLHRVMDPAGGSWFLETLTSEIATKAWSIFQEIERLGGMAKALTSGWVTERIDSAYAPRAKDFANRKKGITGVSEFPNLSEERVQQPPPDMAALRDAAVRRVAAASPADSAKRKAIAIDEQLLAACETAAGSGATLGQIGESLGFAPATVTNEPIHSHAFAQPFEELRDASDAWLAEHGKRPSVFFANLGPVAHFTARSSYAKNFFEAGGFEVLSNEGFADAAAVATAFKASGTDLAIICSSDKLYAEMAAPVATALKAAGAKTVILAGHPGDSEAVYRQAGIDRFIFIKCDVLGTLRELLQEQGVLRS